MNELQNELHQVRLEKQNSLDKVKMLENEIVWLRSLFISKGENLPSFSQKSTTRSPSSQSNSE
ncbi:hypothetical protein K7432_012783 [Basidiobolus ranarum]|uniref:Transposase n=1 Tax=Basidiobolus ranarum TaxID=34480 RepID=A0ABR2VRS3_9FUNG